MSVCTIRKKNVQVNGRHTKETVSQTSLVNEYKINPTDKRITQVYKNYFLNAKDNFKCIKRSVI